MVVMISVFYAVVVAIHISVFVDFFVFCFCLFCLFCLFCCPAVKAFSAIQITATALGSIGALLLVVALCCRSAFCLALTSGVILVTFAVAQMTAVGLVIDIKNVAEEGELRCAFNYR